MCGEADRPDATEAAFTICHTRCRVSLWAPRARNKYGELFPDARAARPRTSIRPKRAAPISPRARSVPCRPSPAPAYTPSPVSNLQVLHSQFPTPATPPHRRPQASPDRAPQSHLRFSNPKLLADQPDVFSISSRASALGSTFHCFGESIFKVGIVIDLPVYQQMPVQMPQRRKLPTHRPPIHSVGEQLLNEIPTSLRWAFAKTRLRVSRNSANWQISVV